MDSSELYKKIEAREFHLDYFPEIEDISVEEILENITRTGILEEHPVMLRHEELNKNKYAQTSDDLLRGLESGQSIHVRNLERIIDNKSPLVKWFFKIQKENAYIADSISCFITPPNSKALSIHHDETDIFTLQLKGHKKWELFNRVVSDKPATYKPEEVEKSKEFIVKKGDFFYLPKGTIHHVSSMGDTSVSVAFIYKPITYSTIIKQLVNEFIDVNELTKENMPFEVNKEDVLRLLKQFQNYIQVIDEGDVEFLMHKILSQQRIKENTVQALLDKIK